MQRRWFIQGVLAGSAALVSTTERKANALPQAVKPAQHETGPRPEARDLPPPTRPPRARDGESLWPTLAPLTPGAEVAASWLISELSAITDGAAIVTLRSETSEAEARVHICRRDADSQAITHSETMDLYLMNGGDGLVLTDESLAVAVETLALVLRRNEARGIQAPESLLSHSARLTFFATQRKLL